MALKRAFTGRCETSRRFVDRFSIQLTWPSRKRKQFLSLSVSCLQASRMESPTPTLAEEEACFATHHRNTSTPDSMGLYYY